MFRDRLGLTQKQLGDYLSVTREEVSYYETGNREISISKIEMICDLFGVQPVDLFEENENLRSINCAVAFKKSGMKQSDLENFAQFRKIAKNYIKMSELLDGTEGN